MYSASDRAMSWAAVKAALPREARAVAAVAMASGERRPGRNSSKCSTGQGNRSSVSRSPTRRYSTASSSASPCDAASALRSIEIPRQVEEVRRSHRWGQRRRRRAGQPGQSASRRRHGSDRRRDRLGAARWPVSVFLRPATVNGRAAQVGSSRAPARRSPGQRSS